jgi:catechol-2,3-dioxygenase
MTAATAGAKKSAVNLKFSHMGISVRDLPNMEKFYTTVLDFTITDRGQAAGMDLVFMSRDPDDHHQVVLATGRPANMPLNTANDQFGPSINQISFKLGSMDDLREIHKRLQAWGTSHIFPANHGIAWSVYSHDPEGNNLEFFVDTEWYVHQPFLVPLELDKTDAEIYNLTKKMCEESPGYTAYGNWRDTIVKQMHVFQPPKQ